MTNQIYVGGLSKEVTEDDLRELAKSDGRTVKKVTLVKNRTSGRSRGFAFIELGSEEEAQAAIQRLNQTEFGGRTIKVGSANESSAREIGTPNRGNRGGGRRPSW